MEIRIGTGAQLLNRLDLIDEVIKSAIYRSRKALVISNIGDSSRELYSLSDGPNNFYMLGSMGMASSVGLGLALLQPSREVLVIDGDASVLMNLGTLATIANSAPRNFHLIIVDNQVNASTGGQPSHTSFRTDLFKVALGAGIKNARKIRSRRVLRSLLAAPKKLPTLIVVKCEEGGKPPGVIPLDQIEIKERFMHLISSGKDLPR